MKPFVPFIIKEKINWKVHILLARIVDAILLIRINCHSCSPMKKWVL